MSSISVREKIKARNPRNGGHFSRFCLLSYSRRIFLRKSICFLASLWRDSKLPFMFFYSIFFYFPPPPPKKKNSKFLNSLFKTFCRFSFLSSNNQIIFEEKKKKKLLRQIISFLKIQNKKKKTVSGSDHVLNSIKIFIFIFKKSY